MFLSNLLINIKGVEGFQVLYSFNQQVADFKYKLIEVATLSHTGLSRRLLFLQHNFLFDNNCLYLQVSFSLNKINVHKSIENVVI